MFDYLARRSRARRRAEPAYPASAPARPLAFFGRRFRNNPPETLGLNSRGGFTPDAGDWIEGWTGATLVTSYLNRGGLTNKPPGDLESMHAPVLDLDLSCQWVDSSTPGHGHLYINRAMPWGDVIRLLDTLVSVGLIQEGFAEASAERGYTAVRTPWTKKPSGGEL